jgi:dienelactone hydrolase
VTAVAVRPALGTTAAVALVLPGGRADSVEPAARHQLSGIRMLPFASALHRGGRRHGLAVWAVRDRFRGWNAELASPVADVASALHQLRERHGDVPVVLVGHSMGGRAAMRVAGDASVVAVAALAPWLPDGEPVAQLAGRRILIAHGDADSVTSPRASGRFAERAATVASEVAFVTVRNDRHAMLRRAPAWHRLTTAFVLDALGLRTMPPHLVAAVARGCL